MILCIQFIPRVTPTVIAEPPTAERATKTRLLQRQSVFLQTWDADNAMALRKHTTCGSSHSARSHKHSSFVGFTLS